MINYFYFNYILRSLNNCTYYQQNENIVVIRFHRKKNKNYLVIFFHISVKR